MWEQLKDHSNRWYGQVAHFFLFQNFVMYTLACIAAHDAIGMGRYVSFLNHCMQWAGN